MLIDDLGSGALADLELFREEPALTDSIAAGCDIVTFSGDKLLGGPQAGIAVGRAAAIDAMRRHPLARALRIDKLDLAALDVVLRLYLDPARAVAEIPTLAALAQSLDDVRDRAGRLRDLFVGAGVPEDRLELVDTVARAGAGALPVTEVPSVAVAATVPPDEAGARAEAAAPRRAGRRLPRAGRPPALRPARGRRGRARGPRRRGPHRPRLRPR